MATVNVGDRVVYTRKFLKNINTPATDPDWRWSGVVKNMEKCGTLCIATVVDDDGDSHRIGIGSIARKGSGAANLD